MSETRQNHRVKLTARARLKFDRVRQQWLLLCPERGLLLSPTAHAIVSRCDGKRRVTEILDELEGLYPGVARQQLEGDVWQLLTDLQQRALLRVEL
jgi:pyrroloquinoline quinone biosynthesis protein D